MRLPGDVRKVLLALGLSALLAACGGASGGYDIASVDARARPSTNGPEADYPQVLGDAFTVDGQLYTPEDTYSYDAVGYAALDREGGSGVSVAHKTLPMPSYVEVTSLETGQTILARVERRGPMTSQRLVALSQGAATQLALDEGAPVRVRRVNPPEYERAELRAGNTVPERLATPESLLAVLKKKLPASGGYASLAGPARSTATNGIAATPVQPSTARAQPVQTAVATPASVEQRFDRVMSGEPKANRAYPLPALAGATPVATTQAASPSRPTATAPIAGTPEVQRYSLPGVQTSAPASANARLAQAPGQPTQAVTSDGAFVVQAAAFSSKANADRLANKLDGGFVTKAGSYYRVRCGPYQTRGQAEAALAKVRAAGYSDARVFSAG